MEGRAEIAQANDSTPFLDILAGQRAGERIHLDQAITSLGPHGEPAAVIARRGIACQITHLEGPSFPLVNGESIGLASCRLAHDDLVELGGMMLRFRLRG